MRPPHTTGPIRLRFNRGSDVIQASSRESAIGFTQLRNPTQDSPPLCEFSRAAALNATGRIDSARTEKEGSDLAVADTHADNLPHVVDARCVRKDPAGPGDETSQIDDGAVSPQHGSRSGEVGDA